MPVEEYEPGTAFTGVIGRTTDESSPAWPRPVRAAAGAPNVLVIVLDDTGFGQLGCYGSPIATPNLDALAVGGLLYTNMHTTALCSPSRSCIITGRNHHANATARPRPAVPRRPAHRPGPVPGHHPYRVQPRRAHLRRQPRFGHHHRLHRPVPVHRYPPHRHRRPVRRPDHRHRQRDAHGHGPPVGAGHPLRPSELRSAGGWFPRGRGRR